MKDNMDKELKDNIKRLKKQLKYAIGLYLWWKGVKLKGWPKR